jgi:phenylacetic acid degradation operon negative regulatory protein
MRRFNELVSTISSAPTSWFVYSAFSYYGARHGWVLPGTWLVRALGDAWCDEAAVRQTLYRMSSEGELETERVGRSKLYRPTAYARAEIEAGTEKILEPPHDAWDGQWTFVHVNLPGTEHRVARKRVEELLKVEGFGRLGTGAYVHPRAVGRRLHASLPDDVRDRVVIVRGELVGGSGAALGSLWDVVSLAKRYAKVLHRLERLEAKLDESMCTNREAFLLRFAIVFEYLGVAWNDPGLPPSLVGGDWPAVAARRRAATLYRRLMPGAVRHSDSILSTLPDRVVRMVA